VLSGWDLLSADVPETSLRGISYADLADQTGDAMREGTFTVLPAPAVDLRQIPGCEAFGERKEILKCTKPGTGWRDASTWFFF